jgi:hypothetical protein
VIVQDSVLKRTTKHKHDTATGTRCQTNNPISNQVQIKLIQTKSSIQEKRDNAHTNRIPQSNKPIRPINPRTQPRRKRNSRQSPDQSIYRRIEQRAWEDRSEEQHRAKLEHA